MVTSDKCYENRSQVWGYREIDPMGGHDPYSASKAAAEIAISSYRHSFFPPSEADKHGIKIASVRAGNVIGGGDWAKDRIVPDAVNALSKGKVVLVRNPGAVRPWQHVLEPLSGYLLLAAKLHEENNPALCSAWNFGPLNSDECPVSALMDLFCEEWGDGCRWEHKCLGDEPVEASVLRLSIDKAVHELKWQPKWDLRETVKRTIEYYREYYSENHDSMAEICYKEINDYMGMIE
jgi:CDP-glucose 4,6-dehydratase